MHNIQRADHYKVDMWVFFLHLLRKKNDEKIFSRVEHVQKLAFENGEE